MTERQWDHRAGEAARAERTAALADFPHTYHHHRCHTALGGRPPIARVINPAGQYA